MYVWLLTLPFNRNCVCTILTNFVPFLEYSVLRVKSCNFFPTPHVFGPHWDDPIGILPRYLATEN